MNIEKGQYHLIVTVSDQETLALQDGKSCGERGGLTPDSKIEVYPLSIKDPAARTVEPARESAAYLDLVAAGLEPSVMAEILGNDDLIIYPPDFMFHRRDIGGCFVNRSEILTPDLIDDERETALGNVPKGGVIVNFAGSIARIKETGRSPLK